MGEIWQDTSIPSDKKDKYLKIMHDYLSEEYQREPKYKKVMYDSIIEKQNKSCVIEFGKQEMMSTTYTNAEGKSISKRRLAREKRSARRRIAQQLRSVNYNVLSTRSESEDAA